MIKKQMCHFWALVSVDIGDLYQILGIHIVAEPECCRRRTKAFNFSNY